LPTITWQKGLPQEWDEKEASIERQQKLLIPFSLYKHRINNIHDDLLTFHTFSNILLYFSKEIRNKVFIHFELFFFSEAININQLLLQHRLPPVYK